MTFRTLVIVAAVALATLVGSQPARARASGAERAIAGEVMRVDHAGQLIVVRTAAGVDETIKFTDRTAVHGLKDVMRASDASAKAGLEGGLVVLRYTGEGADRTAVRVDHIGKRTLKVAKGTVVRVDDAGTLVVIKTVAGVEQTFELPKDVVVQTGKGIETTTVSTGSGIKKGTEVTVHYTEAAGKAIVHILENMKPGPLLPLTDPR